MKHAITNRPETKTRNTSVLPEGKILKGGSSELPAGQEFHCEGGSSELPAGQEFHCKDESQGGSPGRDAFGSGPLNSS